jgi:hypothetical protein
MLILTAYESGHFNEDFSFAENTSFSVSVNVFTPFDNGP